MSIKSYLVFGLCFLSGFLAVNADQADWPRYKSNPYVIDLDPRHSPSGREGREVRLKAQKND